MRRRLHPEKFRWDTLCAEDFYQAELIAPAHWEEASVYIATRYLALFGQFLSARGICQQVYLAFQTPRPESTTRHTLAGQEARQAKLPSRAALQGLADIYSTHAVEPRDRLLINALAMLIVTGFRIGELLTLPVDCEVEEERGGVSRYGLRYYKEKSRGGAKMLATRWLTAAGAELAKKAIEEIRTITVPHRERALQMECDPKRVPLSGFGWADHIRAKELTRILGRTGSKSVYRIPREKYLVTRMRAALITSPRKSKHTSSHSEKSTSGH